MLTNDDPLKDLDTFTTKEMLLDAIRNKREREQAASADTSVGNPLWGSISNVQNNDRTDGGAGRGETPEIYGSDEPIERFGGSSSDFSEQFGRINPTATRDDSSTDQYIRPTTKRSAWDSLKNVGRQYKQIFTKEEKHTQAPSSLRPPKKVDGKKLTDAEALRLRPKLVEYVLWQSEHLDQFIIATTTGHDSSIEIWSDITQEEAEIIVDYLISRGKTDIRTAQAVRYASTLIDRLKLGLIIAPRAYETAMIYIRRGFSIRYA